jgi:hypothetical protein
MSLDTMFIFGVPTGLITTPGEPRTPLAFDRVAEL